MTYKQVPDLRPFLVGLFIKVKFIFKIKIIFILKRSGSTECVNLEEDEYGWSSGDQKVAHRPPNL